MWLQALTPIKIAEGQTVGDQDPPFEAEDYDGEELVKLGAAVEVDAPVPPAPVTKARKAR